MPLPLPRQMQQAISFAARNTVVRRALLATYQTLKSPTRFYRPHPFDQRMGIVASGSIPRYLIVSGTPADQHVTAYLGCAPDTFRRAYALLPDPARRAFLDLGCGLGRALVVASEFPFRSITGIELSPEMCVRARANARTVATRFPDRTPIAVVEGDASRPTFDGPSVVLMYHPFGAELVARTVACVEAAAAAGGDVAVIYANPVHGDLFDASSVLQRRYAGTIAHSIEDRPHQPDDTDAVVIWATSACPLAAHPDCHRAISVHGNGWRSELEP